MAEHPEHIAVVTTAPNEMEAGIIIAALEREGIKATMSGAETSGFRVGVPGEVEILVAAADEAAARRVLEEAADFDEDQDFGEAEE
jgi:Putative prokaryotic signal transducing protein